MCRARCGASIGALSVESYRIVMLFVFLLWPTLVVFVDLVFRVWAVWDLLARHLLQETVTKRGMRRRVALAS